MRFCGFTYRRSLLLAMAWGCGLICLAATPVEKPERLTTQHLPNAVRVHDKVISGGLPEGEAAFAELAEWQVKTIISVDGAKPDAVLAAKHGMRYIHLPHGYEGIAPARVAELAQAVGEFEGPVYIHCHHGKHRSPAAAGAACIAAGLIDPATAQQLLVVAGTGANYRGLFATVDQQQPLDPHVLQALQVDFRESVPVPPLAEAMVRLEHAHENLLRVSAAGWGTPATHPDLFPLHEATLLQEHFKELLRTPEVESQAEEFRTMLANSESLASQLLERLTRASDSSESQGLKLNQVLDAISQDCKACHRQFRDNPTPP